MDFHSKIGPWHCQYNTRHNFIDWGFGQTGKRWNTETFWFVLWIRK